MRKIGLLIVILILLTFAFAVDIDSLESETIVSMLNIYDVEYSISERTLDSNFNLTNNGSAQPSVKYGLEILDSDGYVVATKIADEIVYVGEKESVSKNIEYAIPPYLGGEFELWFKATNKKGAILSVAKAGNISIEATEETVEIMPETCKATIKGGIDEANLSDGLTIMEGEGLVVYCDVVNNKNSPQEFYPVFESYKRNVWSDYLGTEKLEETTNGFDIGEKRKVIFEVPIEEEPQAYDARLYFESNGERISNEVVIHYVVSGLSGTVQMITFEKTKYSVGEEATAQIYWTPSADSYSFSRNITTLEQGTMVLFVTSENGEKCTEDIIIENLETESSANINVPFIMNTECNNPVATVSLKDSQGDELDSLSESFISVEVPEDDGGTTQGTEDIGESDNSFALLIGAIIVIGIILIGAGIFIMKKKKASPKKQTTSEETQWTQN